MNAFSWQTSLAYCDLHCRNNNNDNYYIDIIFLLPLIKALITDLRWQVNASKELEGNIKGYFRMAEGSNKARKALPGSVIDIPSMKIVTNPSETLRKICKFLEITCTEQYLQDCAATVDPVPSITRDFIEWTAEQKNTVNEKMKRYSFFEGYSFDK